MPMNYTTLVSEVATFTVISSNTLVNGDANFAGPMEAIINYAEGRIYRDLDLPNNSITDTSIACSSGVRLINLSTGQGTLLVIESLNLFTSAGTTSSNATRKPLVPTSKAVIDTIYPSALSSRCGEPEYFARVSDIQLILGPTPDQAYGTEVIATIRPAPLSASNSSTWLTQNVPELMLAGCMIAAAGYMRDFGSQADDPKMAQSWEQQYQVLAQSAKDDTQRMKFTADGWTQAQPSPLAQPPRG
jgi:hypothetical protein